jgi:hypothetical protein
MKMDPKPIHFCYYTSLLFLALCFSKCMWISNIFIVFTPISVLFHAKYHDDYHGKQMIRCIDKFLCYSTIIVSFLQAISLEICSIYLNVYYTCLFYIINMFLLNLYIQNWRIHESIHVACVTGLLALDMVK